MNFLLIIGLILIMGIIETLALFSLKKYHDNKNIWNFIASVGLYIIVCMLIVYSLNFYKLDIVNALWNGMTILLVVMASYFIFKQKLTRNELIAIVLIIIAIFIAMKK